MLPSLSACFCNSGKAFKGLKGLDNNLGNELATRDPSKKFIRVQRAIGTQLVYCEPRGNTCMETIGYPRPMIHWQEAKNKMNQNPE